jgi:hypothetical protein
MSSPNKYGGDGKPIPIGNVIDLGKMAGAEKPKYECPKCGDRPIMNPERPGTPTGLITTLTGETEPYVHCARCYVNFVRKHIPSLVPIPKEATELL